MSKIIDADKLYKHIKAECNPYGNPTILYSDGCKVLNIIENTEELPTMQSDCKCDYCVKQGGMLGDCFPKYDMKQCAFKGKKVIEVKDE